jgi:hypothetical protein
MTPIEACAQNLAALEQKLVDARTWQAKIAVESKALSYDAHLKGGESASRLAELQDMARLGEQNIASIETAIAEARKRLAAAQAGELDEAEQEAARMALGLLQGFAARGQALDDKLAAFVTEFESLSADFHDLEKTGYPPSTWPLVTVSMKMAVAARLMGTPLQTDFLAPNQRRTFSQCIEGWAASVRNRAQARLNKGSKETKAA